MAFAGALSAMAAVDGAPGVGETLAVLSRFELGDVSPGTVRKVCEHVLSPPALDEGLAGIHAIGRLPEPARIEILAHLGFVARSDAPLVPAEEQALERAAATLGLADRARARAARRAERERWERESGLERAERVDDARNLLVLAAGLGAPLALIWTLGASRHDGLRLVLITGVYELGFRMGTMASVVAAMVVSVSAAALVSFLTLRGRAVERLVRERVEQSERVHANLAALVAHLGERVREMQAGDARQRAGLVAYENRLQLFVRTLTRLKSVSTAEEAG